MKDSKKIYAGAGLILAGAVISFPFSLPFLFVGGYYIGQTAAYLEAIEKEDEMDRLERSGNKSGDKI